MGSASAAGPRPCAGNERKLVMNLASDDLVAGHELSQNNRESLNHACSSKAVLSCVQQITYMLLKIILSGRQEEPFTTDLRPNG